MNARLVFLQEWLKKRSPRDKLYLFLSGFAFIFFIYFVFILRPVLAQKKDLRQKMMEMQAQQITIRQQIDRIKEIIGTQIFVQLLTEQQRLSRQSDIMLQQLDSLKTDLFSPKQMPEIIVKILSQQRNNVILVSLEQLPAEPWPPLDMVDKVSLLKTVSVGFQHTMKIEFQNDYFNTIEYLNHLEKISKHLYWDSMDYKVLQYPKAVVVIKFHVLSLQKS